MHDDEWLLNASYFRPLHIREKYFYFSFLDFATKCQVQFNDMIWESFMGLESQTILIWTFLVPSTPFWDVQLLSLRQFLPFFNTCMQQVNYKFNFHMVETQQTLSHATAFTIITVNRGKSVNGKHAAVFYVCNLIIIIAGRTMECF